MKFLNQYKQQYRMNLELAMPVVMAQLGQVLVQLVDNAMVGRLGALPLAATSFAGTVFFMVFILGMGLTFGLTPLVGEHFSRNEFRQCSRLFQDSLFFFPVMGIIMTGVLLLAVPVMYKLGQPVEVVDMAIPYFRYIVWSIIPFMLFACFKQFLEGVGNTTITMIIVIACNLVNVALNYGFIYGNWGFPRMEAAGAGLATMISRIMMPVLMIIVFSSVEKFRRFFRFFDLKKLVSEKIGRLFTMGAPISLQMFMEGSAFTLTALMMGWLGTAAIASNQIATIISNFAFMIIVGISSATTIRVSHEFGRKNFTELKKAANVAWHISLSWNFITAVSFILLRNVLPRIFTNDPEVLQLASLLMITVAAFQFSDGLQSIFVGVLRGIQDVNIIILIAFVSYIVINLPVGYLLAFVLGWGPIGLWIGFIFGLSIAAVLLILRYRMKLRQLMREPVEI